MSAWAPFGLKGRRVATYHALDPAAWLKRESIGGPVPKLKKGRKTITVRVPETDAPYLAHADKGWTNAVLGSIASEFPDANLVALCRYHHQVKEVREKFGGRFLVPDEVVDGRGLLEASDLFVGMGGTMNAEASLLGVPTVSSFQGELYTDRYLKSVGLVATARTPGSVLLYAGRFLQDSFRRRFAEKARAVLDSMEDPVPRIVGVIERASEQG